MGAVILNPPAPETDDDVWCWSRRARLALRIVVGVLMAGYTLAIGGLVVGYAKVSNCQAAYNDAAAKSMAARTLAANEDRQLTTELEKVGNIDRKRLRADQDAFLKLIQTLSDTGPDRQERSRAAFAYLERTTVESSRVVAQNDAQRVRIVLRREQLEKDRAANPPPPPPSETC